MKKRTKKIAIISNPLKLASSIRTHFDSYRVKCCYDLGFRSAPYPKGLVFVINDSCNARCKMCDVGTRNETHINQSGVNMPANFLPIKDFKNIIDAEARKRPEIWFMATEPLLYPHFLDAAEYTIGKGLRFIFTSNGILLSRYASDIVRLKVERVLLSFVGGEPDIHDENMGVDGSFRRLVEGIELLNEFKNRAGQAKPSIYINYVITNNNYNKLYRQIEHLSGLDIDKITISNTQFVSSKMVSAHKALYADDKITESSVFSFNPENIDVRVLFEQIKLIFKNLRGLNIAIVPNIKDLFQIERYYKQPVGFLKDYKVCYYPWRFAHILPTGDVVVSWRCFSGSLGNIRQEKFSEIWNGVAARDFRSKLIRHKGSLPACARCGFLWCSYNM